MLERRPAALKDLMLLLEIGAPTLLQVPLEALEPSLDDAEIRKDQLVLHSPGVARGIDRNGCVRHGWVAEHPHDVQECDRVTKHGHVEQSRCAGLAARC